MKQAPRCTANGCRCSIPCYGYYRKTHLEREAYDREIALLADLQPRIADSHRRLVLTRDMPAEEAEPIKEQILVELSEYAEALAPSMHILKRIAHEQLSRDFDLSGAIKKGVTNLYATMTSMRGAVHMLKERFEDYIRPIDTSNEDDRSAVQEKLREAETAFALFGERIARNAVPWFKRAEAAVFRHAPRQEGLFRNDTQSGLAKRFRSDIDVAALKPYTFSPCVTFGTKITDVFEQELLPSLESRDPERFRRALAMMHVIEKMQEVNRTLEQLQVDLLIPERLTIAGIRGRIQVARATFGEFQVFPDIEVAELVPAFTKIERLLAHIEERLREIPAEKTHFNDDPDLVEYVQNLLDEDIEGIVRNISVGNGQDQ
ncbi:MAG: hypothetical protein V1926_05575 [Candidatus Peregrinibacteria bacterium]